MPEQTLPDAPASDATAAGVTPLDAAAPAATPGDAAAPDVPAGLPPARVQPSADVDERAVLGAGTTVWHLAQIREDAVLGEQCIIGRGAYVGAGVRMGNRCKLQNLALVYEPAVLEDGVFVGPAVVFTNDHFPRSIAPDGTLKRGDDWEHVGVTVREGASIGARAVCVAPVVIGRWAMVAAGAVVVRDVPDFALVAGVPARRLRWIGRAGVPLERATAQPATPQAADGERMDGAVAGDSDGVLWVCPQTGARYLEQNETLRELSD